MRDRHSSYRDDSSYGRGGLWSDLLAISLGGILKSCLAVTVALYVLNQKHYLPKPLSAIVSKVLFYPTLPITAFRRLGEWSTVVDDTVILGGAPFGFVSFPEKLYYEYGVRGVVNLCAEYAGPEKQYKQLGITHLRLPTVDHFEPNLSDLEKAVAFIQQHKAQGSKVYVHCRAGHGRSAAVVFAWLLSKDPDVNLMDLNVELFRIRNVRKKLWKQPNIRAFHAKLQGKGRHTSREDEVDIELTTPDEHSSSDMEDESDHPKEL